MPHVIIEYSEEVAGQVAVEHLLNAVHEATLDSGLFPEYDIKTRAIAYQYHRTGQTRDAFVHVALHLLDGRSDAQKSALADGILGKIEPMLPGVSSVGVEIIDIHRSSYRKRVLE
ncbi:MAG: 5-carboxymethyl-2-hydroxymuconate Delta-isomerase [Gammaproteobacteria bacterium]|nr:MAG: 5-carboxymethyl-2-hydroxymuconate Delta-isomerase [Gammaproteobacteria bacterium]UCH39946.1 MAG: 5-carboxymethyl-2-hydroxymuconate Delta-isomerase [Gammaproteobacteria bacterium]